MRHQAILPALHLKQARLQFVERGITPTSGIDLRLAQSWQRSLSAGLSPVGRADCADNLSSANLQYARDFNHELISHSEPVIEYLFDQVKHSHSMVILADAQGVLMHTLGDLDFLSKAERVALKCGANWAENQRGTNAIGTALAEAAEIEINGAEHYLEPNEFLTCAAAPILSAQGHLLGILDISGDQRSRHPHTLGLVSTAAQMIENSMVLGSCQHPILLQLHTRAEGIGSVAQAILVFSEDGYLLGANRRALALLNLGYSDLARIDWRQLFDQDLHAFMSRQRRSTSHPEALICRDGRRLFAQFHPHSKSLNTITTQSQVVQDAVIPSSELDRQWQTAADKARKLIDKGIPLLLHGESGVGKEVFAQAVHHSSQRREKAFVAVNCAAIPEHLIESELFGYVAGAFTGASRHGVLGRLREAHGGSLFLDEIGDMPLMLQTRLLRVLQERKVTPLGSSSAIPVDFNLICATHRDLKESVTEGRFREDLFYRINGLTLDLPPLRQRTDFAALCRNLLREISPHSLVHIDADVLSAMQLYAWPGNLRQLSHVLRAAAALLDEGETEIGWAHLSQDLVEDLRRSVAQIDDLHQRTNSAAGTVPESVIMRQGQKNLVPNIQQNTWQLIQQALQETQGNVSAAARNLGISRQTLYRKLQEHVSTKQ
ncbi:sigma-54-dependent Fis family transcriptional regulator [Undibacterium macrobrachii]|jgi:transcriptional regulator of acetoin/glycerol metabolism|uniref:Sigma-54-dependent Fis family transcriptional regulator n=1 Tax=Undibacterium macrobrachii TaxID=1119058 RepID=A0ABQ2XLS6_9BURK|nr:sigma-54-dependent Fis family transcriptional regulator [Undibacterium macrobrachii]GGX22859.1 sigma-54-dependent Fis family transcriptional regulator [Undibacterium macrobrachii]